MKRLPLALAFVGLAFTTLVSGQGGDPGYGKPKRLNKMIELLAAGQPVCDVGVTGGGYEEGKKLAQTLVARQRLHSLTHRQRRGRCPPTFEIPVGP
jgi:hypothetical protein